MTNADVIRKLVGEITPIGETTTDDTRFKNLKELCFVVECLMGDIDRMGNGCKNFKQYSIKRSSDYAIGFLNQICKEFKQA